MKINGEEFEQDLTANNIKFFAFVNKNKHAKYFIDIESTYFERRLIYSFLSPYVNNPEENGFYVGENYNLPEEYKGKLILAIKSIGIIVIDKL